MVVYSLDGWVVLLVVCNNGKFFNKELGLAQLTAGLCTDIFVISPLQQVKQLKLDMLQGHLCFHGIFVVCFQEMSLKKKLVLLDLTSFWNQVTKSIQTSSKSFLSSSNGIGKPQRNLDVAIFPRVWFGLVQLVVLVVEWKNPMDHRDTIHAFFIIQKMVQQRIMYLLQQNMVIASKSQMVGPLNLLDMI